MKEFYKQAIIEAVDGCTDVDLLDFVWKMLLTANPQPTDSNVVYLENINERSNAA